MSGTPLPERLAIRDTIRGLVGEELELVTGIHYVASPESTQAGMTLDGDEVAIISKLLRQAGY